MNKPNSIETLRPFSGRYSYKADLKVNAWFFVAVLVSIASRATLDRSPDWTGLLQVAVVLSPLVPSILWVRSLIRFIRGMDELERRIQFEAWLMAVLASLFVGTAINMLNAHDAGLPVLRHGLEFGPAVLLTFGCWIVANRLITRRYQ